MKNQPRKTTAENYYSYKDRKITCENYSLESATETCKLCSNKRYCRESRKVIKLRIQIAKKYNEKVTWENFINEVTTRGSTLEKYSIDEDEKEPAIPRYQREENILKLNWDGYYARAHTPKRKSGGKGGRSGRKSTLSAKALKQIRYGDVPTLKVEIK